MYKYCLFLFAIIAFLSCSKDEEEYEIRNCRVEIKEGSSFTICTKFGDPIEDLFFEENTTLYGEKITFASDKNQCTYLINSINKYFKVNKVEFNDLNITFVCDTIRWVKNNSSETNFCFDNIDYFAVNDSVCHFSCYGEKRTRYFLYSSYDTMIRINANIKIELIDN